MKLLAIILPALMLLGAAADQTPVAAQEPELKVAVEGKFPPFNYVDANGMLQGFDVEIADALCRNMKSRCTFVMQDWNDMIPGLLDSEYDAIVSSMSMSETRRQQVDFTERYYNSPSTMIAPKNSGAGIDKPADLRGVRLGVASSTSQEAYARQHYPDAEIVIFESSPALYDALIEEQVDIVLEDKLAAYDWLSNTRAGLCCQFSGEDITDARFFGEGAGIAIRKQDDALEAQLNEALDAIMTNGEYDMINAKYFPFSIR